MTDNNTLILLSLSVQLTWRGLLLASPGSEMTQKRRSDGA